MSETITGAAPAAAEAAPVPLQLRPGASGLAVAPPAPAPAPAAISATDALVERWWDDFFPGSAVAQSTAAWNTAFAAKEELKRRLQKGQ